MSVIPVLGREVVVEAKGRQWRVARMSIEVLDRFLDWARPQRPDPFAGLKDVLPALDKADALALVKDAQAEAKQLIGYDAPFVRDLMATDRGRVHLFKFLLQVHQPDVTLDDVTSIAAEIGAERLANLFREASGRVEGNAGKAEAPVTV